MTVALPLSAGRIVMLSSLRSVRRASRSAFDVFDFCGLARLMIRLASCRISSAASVERWWMALYSITADVLMLTGLVSQLKALTCLHWWGMILTSSYLLVGWMSGSWTQNWARFGWRPLRHWGGSLRLKASVIGCRRAVPLFIYTQAFALQLRKSRENLSQSSRAVLRTARSVDLASL
jgi:hypothetical protein